MTTATVTHVRGTERAVTSWLASTGWAIVLGAASGSACVAIRLFFRLLQWVFVQQTEMLPIVAATLPPARRIVTPIIGAALATLLLWMMRRWAPDLHFEEYVEAVRLRGGRIPLLSTVWRTASSAFSVATGAAIGREGSMIQFAAAISSWVGERSPLRNLSLSRQVAYGAAAAVAAAYQAPIAGIFFATEIVLGEWVWSDIPQLLSLGAFRGEPFPCPLRSRKKDRFTKNPVCQHRFGCWEHDFASCGCAAEFWTGATWHRAR
jgi:CIC family chloride channel protein